MGEVIKRHALLFTVALGGVVLLVLVILMRQKSKGAAASTNTTASGTTGDAGLTAGYPPSLAENITNIYGSSGSTGSSASSTGSAGSPAPVGPPIAPPPASGANSITTNAVYSGSAGRVPPEPPHGRLPLFRTPPVPA